MKKILAIVLWRVYEYSVYFFDLLEKVNGCRACLITASEKWLNSIESFTGYTLLSVQLCGNSAYFFCLDAKKVTKKIKASEKWLKITAYSETQALASHSIIITLHYALAA